MNMVKRVHEDQLWLWLEDCEARKPSPRLSDGLPREDQVVRVLQYEVREGREASEA